MSKFDRVYRRISEALPVTPAQPQQPVTGLVQQPKPATGTQPQVTPQQQKQALEQFAQAMGVDAAALQKAIDTLKQQKPAAGTQTTNQAV